MAARILDVSEWADFEGYGPIPAIRSAAYEVEAPGVVGSRIRVTNADGSSHVEEIVEWEPDTRLVLRLRDFSPPLSTLARDYEERWDFVAERDHTRVRRSLALTPRSAFAWLPLRVIAALLERAIARHLRQMREAG